MTSEDKIKQFKKELRELLDKYGAAITCDIEGDTHCLMYKMVVDFEGDRKEYTLTRDNGIEAFDLA